MRNYAEHINDIILQQCSRHNNIWCNQSSKNLLSENGSFIFEVHYLMDLLETDQFDMIYHEHVLLFSDCVCKNTFALWFARMMLLNWTTMVDPFAFMYLTRKFSKSRSKRYVN